jgi:hypothetical protein
MPGIVSDSCLIEQYWVRPARDVLAKMKVAESATEYPWLAGDDKHPMN